MSNKSWPEGQVAQDTLKSSKSVEGDISTTIYSRQESEKCSRNIPILASPSQRDMPQTFGLLLCSMFLRWNAKHQFQVGNEAQMDVFDYLKKVTQDVFYGLPNFVIW